MHADASEVLANLQGIRRGGSDGTRTRDLRRDRPARVRRAQSAPSQDHRLPEQGFRGKALLLFSLGGRPKRTRGAAKHVSSMRGKLARSSTRQRALWSESPADRGETLRRLVAQTNARGYEITRAISAFWACSRFSAWSQTADRSP